MTPLLHGLELIEAQALREAEDGDVDALLTADEAWLAHAAMDLIARPTVALSVLTSSDPSELEIQIRAARAAALDAQAALHLDLALGHLSALRALRT